MTEDTDNLRIWSQVCTPPPDALKPIKAGRLKGMTDIDPMWRYQRMTELFGPCGKGWGVDVTNRSVVPAGETGEMMVFISGTVWWEAEGDPRVIPFESCSHLVKKESAGLYVNDEAPKIALTDGLGKALSMLGVAADVYMGKMDGSKYRDGGGAAPAAPRPNTAPVPTVGETAAVTAVAGTWSDDMLWTWPAEDARCPICGSEMWDNRTKSWDGKPSPHQIWQASGESPKVPVFKCRKSKEKGHALWLTGLGKGSWENQVRALWERRRSEYAGSLEDRAAAAAAAGPAMDAMNEHFPQAEGPFDEVPF